MNRKEDIISWLKEGCSIQQGVALYLKYGDNSRFKVLLSVCRVIPKHKLKLILTKIAGIKSSDYSSAVRGREQDKFRQMYPFLSAPDCPLELKALAADKITTYWLCVELHKKLFDCHKNTECLEVARALVNTFIEDQKIKQELDYYKEHNGILGEHRIFEQYKRQNAIRRLNLRELIRKEKQLKDSIWRIKSEMAKDNKPHLQHEREVRLQEKERELKLVESLLDGTCSVK